MKLHKKFIAASTVFLLILFSAWLLKDPPIVKGDSTDIYADHDVYVYLFYPDTNYDGDGYYNNLSVRQTPGKYQRTFVHFNLSSIPNNADIDSATLKLYFYNYTGGGTPRVFRVSRVNESWSESTATWNNQPDVNSSNSVTKNCGTSLGWWEVNVTLMTQDAWALGSEASFRIKDEGEGEPNDILKRFYSKEFDSYDPVLSINYTISNNAPSIGEFQASAIVYANQYCFLNATITDDDGLADFVNATLEVNGSIVLKWLNSTNTFSESSDANGYCTLDSGGSVRTTVNSTSYKLSWRIKLYWNYTEGSIFALSANTIVFDDDGENGAGTDTSLFTFEDDLIIHTDASASDGNVNPSQETSLNGTLYYYGTSTVPEDVTGITTYVELSGVEKGNDTACTGGVYNVTVTAESSVANYSYNVYAVTDETSVSNQTVYVVVNKAYIPSGGVAESSVHVGENTTVYFVLQYQYEATNITDGEVYVNSTLATYNGTSLRWEANLTSSTNGNHSFSVSSVSGNSYGITTLNDTAGAQTCTFFSNIYLRTVDTEGDAFSGCTVYMTNGTGEIGDGGGEGSTGYAVIGGTTYSSVVDSGGWANWTGITNASVQIYAVWYGLTVNATWDLATTTDQTVDVSCLCYPYTPDSTTYYCASDATISTVTYTNYILNIQFSDSESTYTLVVTGSRPTYILNAVYDLASDYTTYLSLTHYANETLYISYGNWGTTYIQSTDHKMTSASWEEQKLTMVFSGSSGAIGEVKIYCGSRGNPASKDGFTTTSYSGDTVFTGTFTFASSKTVWVRWTSEGGSSPDGGTSGPTIVLIDIVVTMEDLGIPDSDVSGLLAVTWSGQPTIYLWDLIIEEPYASWDANVAGLPILLTKNVTEEQGYAEISFTVSVPGDAEYGDYSLPVIALFGTQTGATKESGTVAYTTVGSYVPPTVPNLLTYVFLGLLGLVVATTTTATIKKRRRRRV